MTVAMAIRLVVVAVALVLSIWLPWLLLVGGFWVGVTFALAYNHEGT